MDHNDDYSWVRPYLSAGEQILWRGKPERFSLLEKQDLYLIPFSILWCGFAIFWEYLAISHGPLLFKIWGIPFVCAGLYFVAGRFLHKRYVLLRTAYVITDRKIIRKAAGKVDLLHGSTLPPMEVARKDDGSGTICFATPGRQGYGVSMSPTGTGFSLVGLSNVERALAAVEAMCDNKNR